MIRHSQSFFPLFVQKFSIFVQNFFGSQPVKATEEIQDLQYPGAAWPPGSGVIPGCILPEFRHTDILSDSMGNPDLQFRNNGLAFLLKERYDSTACSTDYGKRRFEDEICLPKITGQPGRYTKASLRVSEHGPSVRTWTGMQKGL